MTNGFNRFNKSWGSSGLLDDPTDPQADAGWAYIGQAPPTVEQFNSVEQWGDDRFNWLYNQIANVITASGGAPSAADLNGLLDAIQLLGRKRLTADFTINISPTGSDTTGDGSASKPFASLTYAWGYANRYLDLNGHNLTYKLAPGNYQGALLEGTPLGLGSSNSIVIAGTLNNPADVVINSVINPTAGNDWFLWCEQTRVVLQDLTLGDGSYTPLESIVVVNSNVNYNRIHFGAVQYCLHVATGGICTQLQTATITGPYSQGFIWASSGGAFFFGNTLQPPPTLIYNVACTAGAGHFYSINSGETNIDQRSAFSGAGFAGCTGRKYDVDYNGIINSGSFALTGLPGNQAGIRQRGGQDGTIP